MKKTYNINLNGQVFCIDDDAYLKLKSYIDTLEQHYLKEESGKEIMADIETRIGELLKEVLEKGYKQVVSVEDIDSIVQVMGSPDAIIDEDVERGSGPIKRKLYRDRDESILGGVASGIAAHFNISVAWIRLAFVLLAFLYGMTIIAYLILWIIIPAATTSRQKLEMKGEKVNVSNIEKNIRDTYNSFKKNSGLPIFFDQVVQGIKVLLQKSGLIFGKVLRMVFLALSFLGISGGTFLFLLLFWCLFYPAHISNPTINHLLYNAVSPGLLTGIKIILLLILDIPLLLVVYISARYLFRFNWNRIFILAAIGCWFLAGFIGIIIAFQQILNYSDTTESTDTRVLSSVDTTSRKYILNFKALPQFYEHTNLIRYSECISNILAFDSLPPKGIYLKAFMDITPTTSPYPSVSVRKKVRGAYNDNHSYHLDNIRYQWEQQGNELYLDTYFKISKPVWKGQETRVTLSIPEGDTLVIHGNCYWKNMDYPAKLPYLGQGKYLTTVMQEGRLKIID